MVHSSAFSIGPTRSNAGIHTFFPNTCFVIGTIFINCTFWFATRRCTDITRVTAANCGPTDISTSSKKTTGVRFTWGGFCRRLNFLSGTSCEWVSFESSHTSTIWAMTVNPTLSILSTSANTWVDTFLSYTSLIQRTFWTC